MNRRLPRWVGSVAGLAVLGLVVWRVSPSPFLDGVRSLNASAVAAALSVTALTTLASADRWRVMARGLGVHVSLPQAVRAYYRSQLLNATLPVGVLGDAERGLRHGRDDGARGAAMRSVIWERGAGQAVQLLATAVVLLWSTAQWGAPLGVPISAYPATGVALAVVFLVGVALAGAAICWRESAERLLETVRMDVRVALQARRAWPRVIVASLLVVAGHVTVFLVAARASGMVAPAATMIPAALVVLGASAIPANVAGWGPREGAAAAVFASAGLGTGAGVAASAAYGVLVLVSVLPGILILVAGTVAEGRRSSAPPQPPLVAAPPPGAVGVDG